MNLSDVTSLITIQGLLTKKIEKKIASQKLCNKKKLVKLSTATISL